MNKFQGHEINHNHYRASRQIEGFYPSRGIDKGVILGRIFLGITVALLVAVIMLVRW